MTTFAYHILCGINTHINERLSQLFMKKTNLCVLFGGKSTEYEVSLRSAFTVLSNIDKEKYNVTTVGITKKGCWYQYSGAYENIRDGSWGADVDNLTHAQLSLNPGENALITIKENACERIPVDVVIPVMHGAFAEDGTLQGVLEMSGIPFVGPGCASSAVCMDKAFTKQILNNCGIPQAKCEIILKSELDKNPESVKETIGSKFEYPVFIKPSNSGSSVGASKVRSAGDLISALKNAAMYDEKILVEEFIDAQEIEVAVLGNDELIVSECGEINTGSEFYDYETKYISNTSSYYIPAHINEETSGQIRMYAEKIYRTLGCKGLSRVDFFVRRGDGAIIFNEINTLPGFTSISMYPKLIMHTGISLPDIIDRLVLLAKTR